MGKPTICIGENKEADQLRGNSQNLIFLVSSDWHCSNLNVLTSHALKLKKKKKKSFYEV